MQKLRRLLMPTLLQFGASWQRAPTILVLALLFFAGYEIDRGSILYPLLAFYALTYFVTQTWPQRWLINIVIVWCLITASADFILVHAKGTWLGF